MDASLPGLDLIDIAWRLGAAVVVGMLIGLNRDLADKPIGMRTLGLVSLGAAVVAISTVHFRGLAEHPDALSRVVQGVTQGVMAGIGFIGAGVILRDTKEKTVKGLTTAATVWVTAALGLACGFAAWQIVALSLGLALFLLVGVAWIEDAFEKAKRNDQR
ncbi:MAG TPA: MgtC/SapB family protein [Methyloceanibacter sp.]|nr:MgtC/SapB family protein [Methyloceanibacter sp.]